jgi:hypothetical protein
VVKARSRGENKWELKMFDGPVLDDGKQVRIRSAGKLYVRVEVK